MERGEGKRRRGKKEKSYGGRSSRMASENMECALEYDTGARLWGPAAGI